MDRMECFHCGQTSFRRDQENDLVCRACSRLQPRSKPTLPSPSKKKVGIDEKTAPRENVPGGINSRAGLEIEEESREDAELTPAQKARKRYRNSDLYRETRIKSDRKYTKSPKYQDSQNFHKEKRKVMRRVGKTLLDWIEGKPLDSQENEPLTH